MSELSPDLHRLGAALEQAAADDVNARAAARRPLLRRPRVLLAVAAAIVLPSAAFAADQLLTTNDVAQSMPAGAWIFGGRTPTCTVVTENVEYRCVLDRAPKVESLDANGNPLYKGVVEETVDSNHVVNGGCRGTSTDGLVWECYIGEKAVQEQIISQGFLGQTVSGPGRG